jgi:hypothetical protein
MKNLIIDEYKVKLEKVPLGCNSRNAADVAIRNFKAHFLSARQPTTFHSAYGIDYYHKQR